MGHIKEPKGVDFIIQSEPLTDVERKSISEFIQKDKVKSCSKVNTKKQLVKYINFFYNSSSLRFAGSSLERSGTWS